MRILFWSETFWPRIGGVENLAAKLLPALQERGYEFLVITWENTENTDLIQYNGTPVYRLPFFSVGRQSTLNKVYEHIRQVVEIKRAFSPSLVHVNSYGRSVFFHLATANTSQAPLLLTLHQPLPDEPVIQNTLLQKVINNSDWVTACSSSTLKHSRELVPDIIPRSSFIRNAIEKPAFIPQPLSFNPPKLLCLGRLVLEKGFDLVLPAFAAVLERFPSATLWIAGDGPERERLQKQVSQLRLRDSVEFMGSVPADEVFHLIDKATLVLAPSRVEGFGLAALEAAMMARPVVATRVGGLPEIVVHGHTGLLVDSGDSAGMAEAIIFLLDQQHTAAQMGQAARHRVETEFSWKGYVDAYDDLYRKLIMHRDLEHSNPGVY